MSRYDRRFVAMLTPAVQSPAPPPRVLVVDDSAVIRQAIEKMLKAEFEIVLAEDGEAGWDKLARDEQIQAMITDIDMPRLDGYAFICRVRAADSVRIRDIPIITMTGAEDEETRLRAYACGATDFITKPLDSKELQARLHAYVQSGATAPREAGEGEARVDPQTGLHTRRSFMQRGAEEMKNLPAEGALFLVRLDLDDLKRVYQKLGDDAMESLLTQTAARLRERAPQQALAARVGGGEFALLAPFTSSEAARVWCEGLRADAEAQVWKIGRQTVTVTVSIGLASADDARDIESLLALVERRLLRAKSDGGNRVSMASLGEDLLAPEEVVLAAVPSPSDQSDENGAEVEALPVGELEALLESEANPDAMPWMDLISLDKAVERLARGEDVDPFLGQLVDRVLPLIEAYNEQERLGLESALRRLRERLDSQS